MHRIVERERLVPNIHLLRVEAPDVARKIKPGNFVIIKIDEFGERIPLTVADWDANGGVLTIVFMTVGVSTHKLARLKAGDVVEACVGPLGKSAEVEKFGTVACLAGCYGIGALLPVAKAMKSAGNKVISIVEARMRNLLYWTEKYDEFSDRVVVTTFDGSSGKKGYVTDGLEEVIKGGEALNRVVVQGCTYMMMKVSKATLPYKIKTIVSLNPIMIDGTGMCGVCRCSVGGKTKFACVDGPDFDGHEVDWDVLMARRRSYLGEELRSISAWECATY